MPKKKFLISLNKPDRRVKGMNIGGKFHKFGNSGHSFITSDPGVASEMNREYGRKGTGDILVSEIPGYSGKDNVGHKYSFTIKKQNEDPKKRRERMIADGWVEIKPGRWQKKQNNVT